MGVENAGDRSLHGSLNDGNLSNDFSSGYEEKMDAHEDVDSHHDEGAPSLDIMVGLLEENDKIKQLKDRVIQLQNDFISDIDSRIEQMNTKYLNGLCKFCTVYKDTIKKSEPVTSATPQLSSLLHSHFVKNHPATTKYLRNETYQGTTYSYCKVLKGSEGKSICTLRKAP